MSDAPSRTRALQDVPAAAALAVELLTTASPAVPLSAEDARRLLPYWRLVDAPAGSALMAEGDQLHTGHLLLVLEGQVTVDSGADHVALAVVGRASCSANWRCSTASRARPPARRPRRCAPLRYRARPCNACSKSSLHWPPGCSR